MYCVYEHVLDDEVFYVGHGNEKRPYVTCNRSKEWWDYVKDRKDDVQIKIIKKFESKNEAYNFEIEWSIKRRNEGYHIQGLIGRKWSDEAKRKMSNKKISDEQRQKLSNAMKGRRLSEEHKKKLSSSHKGKKLSEEHKRNISIGEKGRIVTNETRTKISNSLKGHIGVVHTDEAKKKISEASKRRWEKYRNMKDMNRRKENEKI